MQKKGLKCSVADFEEIKEKLKESLTVQRIQQNRAQMMQELMKSSKIEISKGL